MILIRMELISARDGHREILGEAIIANDATGTLSRGNYEVQFSKRGGLEAGIWKTGRIVGFPRRKRLAWDLLARALHEIVGERP